MDPIDDGLDNKIKALRDNSRPGIEDVADVLSECFDNIYEQTRIAKVKDGPDEWVWVDENLEQRGLAKEYTLRGSRTHDIIGYPMLEIRQAFSVRLDTWVCTSTLVTGPDRKDIAKSLSLAIANHSSTFEGFRYSVNSVLNAGGDPLAGMAAAKELRRIVDVMEESRYGGSAWKLPEVPPPPDPEGEMN